MNDYLTDEEQVERIKKWWSDNGTSVIAGLVIGFGGLGGWRFWVNYQDNVAAEASAHFSDAMTALEGGQHDSAIEQANIVLSDYGSSVYAELARLSLAKAYVETGKYEQAEQQLRLMIDATNETALEMIARTRLAAVLVQQQKLNDALDVLQVDYPAQFTAAFEELKGDILAARGERDQARDAYRKAQLADPPAPNTQFLQRKLDDLGAATASS